MHPLVGVVEDSYRAPVDRRATLCHAAPMRSDGSLLTAPQVGALIGKSGRTVVRLAEKGGLPIAQKLPGPNGAYLFRQEDVDGLVATLRARVPAA